MKDPEVLLHKGHIAGECDIKQRLNPAEHSRRWNAGVSRGQGGCSVTGDRCAGCQKICSCFQEAVGRTLTLFVIKKITFPKFHLFFSVNIVLLRCCLSLDQKSRETTYRPRPAPFSAFCFAMMHNILLPWGSETYQGHVSRLIPRPCDMFYKV